MLTSPPFVTPARVPQPVPWPAPQPAGVAQAPGWSPRPANPPPQAAALTQQLEPRRPVVRLQAPEELMPPPPPKRLVLPSPEQLGVAGAGPASAVTASHPDVDWNVTRDRLHGLGAIGFHLAKLPEGAFRVAFLLPTTHPGRLHQIEAEAPSEGTAVCRALDLADQWTRARH
jgi:hypothetical protein